MRIIYYYSKLNIGGAERSTVRLLNKMAQCGHSVTLLLRWSGGKLEQELDRSVQVIHLKKNLAGGAKLSPTAMILETLKMPARLGKLKRERYDLVISGLFGYNPSILFKYISGKRYCQMLRNDVSKTGQYGKTAKYMSLYGSKFDCYVGVSEYTTESFRKCYPQYADRARTIYNILPDVDPSIDRPVPEIMKSYAHELKILTVCRLADQAKGLFRMEAVCKKLSEVFPGHFKWFIVGSGPDGEKLKELIAADKLEDTMILCGGTSDPFPYYAFCDLVAVLSYYEGLCGVVNEAKMMCKPVIATEFSGIYEQIQSGKNGLVIANDESSIYDALYNILNNPDSIKNWAVNQMPKELLDNERKIRQFEEILEEEK